MSAAQAVFSGWMEIADKAVYDEARHRADDAALAALVSQYSATLYRVAYSVLRNSADAEDAVQEAFLRVLRHRDSLAELRDQRLWLIRIVWNVVLDRKRRMKTRPETDDVAELARVLPAAGLSAEPRWYPSLRKSAPIAADTSWKMPPTFLNIVSCWRKSGEMFSTSPLAEYRSFQPSLS